MAKHLRGSFLALRAATALAVAGLVGRVGLLWAKDNPLPPVSEPQLVDCGGWALDATDMSGGG